MAAQWSGKDKDGKWRVGELQIVRTGQQTKYYLKSWRETFQVSKETLNQVQFKK